MTINIFNCLRCGHEWPSTREHPEICPKCKSHLWDTPKKKRRRRAKSIGADSTQSQNTNKQKGVNMAKDKPTAKEMAEIKRKVNDIFARASRTPLPGKMAKPADSSHTRK
jgi:DNA-directed RNA polymerase subunit M/transcription elongation factor TFIIS